MYTTKAITLNKKDWREGSQLYFLYTEKFGKQVVVGRGTKKVKSKLAGHLEPFNLNQITFIKGKKMNQLIQASLIKENKLKKIEDFYFINIINELYLKILEENEVDSYLWDLLIKIYDYIFNEQDVVKKNLLLNVFVIKFLNHLGYTPEIKSCVSCLKPVDEIIGFSLKSGGVICYNCSSQKEIDFSNDLRKFLQKVLENKGQLILKTDIKIEFNSFINKWILFLTGREVNSFSVMVEK